MFNLVVLSGRLTANPELKTTPNGVPVCTFTIAVERRYKQGEERKADFINIVAWRSSAEFVSKNFRKGEMIGIEGSIQTRKYQDRDGNNRTAFEVVANNVQFVEGKKDNSSNIGEGMCADEPQQSNTNNDFTDMGEVGDGDLPF